MKQILQNPTARLWCLSGLTGMVLMAGVLLDEGQARTYSPSPDIVSIQINELNRHTPSSETSNAGKSQTLKTSREQKVIDPVTHKQVADKQPAKKRMGLAILFLGLLAEEG